MNQRGSIAYSMNSKLSFKVIVVGDLAVGKTSLVMRYIKDFFSKDYKVTVGFEFFSKVVQHEGEDVTVQIWDTVQQLLMLGRPRGVQIYDSLILPWSSLRDNDVQHGQVRDIRCRPETLEALEKWGAEVKEYSHPEVVKVLVGSKSDLVSQDVRESQRRINGCQPKPRTSAKETRWISIWRSLPKQQKTYKRYSD